MPTLIFDCDGVLADTEPSGHLPAFNRTFAELGLVDDFGNPLIWTESEYANKVVIGGGKERMMTLLTPAFIQRNNLPTDEAAQRAMLAAWHERKTSVYTRLIESGAVPARPGIRRVVTEAHAAGWQLAVASTSAERSVRAVLSHAVGEKLAATFTIFAGDIVTRKKPAPDIYLLAVEALSACQEDTIVVEDSAAGMAAAHAAGLPVIVTQSAYTAGDDTSSAVLAVTSLGDENEPAEVVSDPFALLPGTQLGIKDLTAALLASRKTTV